MSELDRILAELTSLTDRLTETVDAAEQAPVGPPLHSGAPAPLRP